MTQISKLLIFIIIASGIHSQLNSQISVTQLSCNSKENIVVVGTNSISFSWKLIADSRNQKQSAYQILVSDNLTDIKSSNGNIWNSGKILSDQSILVPFSGIALHPGSQYFWKVKAWNQDGKESEWSETASFKTALFSISDWGKAQWIGYRDLPQQLKVVPGVHGSGDELGDIGLLRPIVPLFRKEFEISGEIETATLYITGLGQYEASINGQKVGNSFLSPGWTNYDKTILYNTFDVTQMLSKGKNAITAIAGNGFYNINRERYRKLVIAYGEPKLIAQLRIRYKDGSEKIIVTGADWKTIASPVTFTSIYGGEDYDARMEQPGWNVSGFNEHGWQNAQLVNSPAGKLVSENDYPLQLKDSFSVKTVLELKDKSYLYDFGQNASGIIEVKVKGKKGQQIRLTPSELITKDNLPNQAASGSPYYFSYILKGDGIETWRPVFTYYGFRYVRVEGAIPDSFQSDPEKAHLLELKFFHNRNSAPEAGSFSCSNELINRTYQLINWAIKSNLQSVLTDCPHREKLGWLEQTYLMGSSVHFNYDLHQLYHKIVEDMMEAQLRNGLVPDIAPEYVPFNSGFRDSPEWGSASVILPWLIYKWYGDTAIMKEAWPMMVRYVNYLKSKSDHHILKYGLGDWYDLGLKSPGPAQLTPIAITATSIYFYDLKLLSSMAAVLKKTEEHKQFSKWAEEIKTAFNSKFFNPGTGNIATSSQTSMAMPWSVGLVEDEYKNIVMQNLEDSIHAGGNALTAGDIGFHFLIDALTNSRRSQLLYEMNARNDVPGYGFQLKKGATALTESWAGLDICSNNHLMLGHLMDWFYSGLAGISQSEYSAAYKRIVIKPEIIGDLSWVRANYQSPYGEIQSNWEKTANEFKLNVKIPVNTDALIYLPDSPNSTVYESGKDISVNKDIKLIGKENGRIIFEAGSGIYSFSVNFTNYSKAP